MKKSYLLIILSFLLVILEIQSAKADKNIYDAGVVELETPKALTQNPGLFNLYKFVVKICNYTKTDSLKNVKLKWAILEGDVQYNYGFSWDEKTADFSQQPASPFMKAIIPNDYYREIDFTPSMSLETNSTYTIFITTDKPNGEDDINHANDTLRFVLRKLNRDPGINQIYAPTQLSSDPTNDTIRIEIFNYGNSILKSVDVKWKVTDKNGKGGSFQTTTIKLPYTIKPEKPNDVIWTITQGKLYDTVLATYPFHNATSDMLISAQITGCAIVDTNGVADDTDFNENNNYAWQYVTTPKAGVNNSIDAQAFTIDNPQPGNHSGKQEILVTVKNNGPQPLKSCQLRWIVQDFAQVNLVSPNDWALASFYSTECAVYKMGAWNTTNFVFNNPVDSGKWVQLSLGKADFGSGTKTVTVVPWHPNGVVGSTAKDTARLFLGDYMLGAYSIGKYKNESSQYNTINDAMDKLRSMGMPAYVNEKQDNKDPTKNRYLPSGFPSGVQFYVRPGTYKENIKISGLFPNGSNSNNVLFQAYGSDSTSYKIKPASTDATVNFDGTQYLKFVGFTVDAPKDGHAVLFNNNSKNIIFGSSQFIGNTTKTDADATLVYGDGKIDSSEVSSSFFLGGSYGFFWNGSSGNKSSGVTLAKSTFLAQNNVSVSMYNIISPAALKNNITNNRMEAVNCENVVMIKNRVYVFAFSDKITGVGYSSEPFSAVGLINCKNKIVINGGNVCVDAQNFNGIHFKDCSFDTTDISVINGVSAYSQEYPIWLDNAQNVTIVNTSADLPAAMSENSAGLFIDKGSTGTVVINSVITSTGGGMPVVIDSKGLLQNSGSNDFYATGHSIFARIKSDNKFLDLNNWKAYFLFDSDFLTRSVEPNYYDPPCDLIAQGVGLGYQSGASINTNANVEMYYPKNNAGLYDKPDVMLQWRNYLNVYGYWLQVRKNTQFNTIKNKLPDVLSNDDELILDLPEISSYIRDTTQGYPLYALEPNTTYYWRLRVYAENQRSNWGQPESFNTGDITGIPEQIINNVKDMEIFPNPLVNDALIALNIQSPGNYSIIIYNSLGSAVGEISSRYFVRGINKLFLHEILDKELTHGAYYIIATGNGETYKAGFIKE